jgi:RimJ/RimL family protein N-acetyltransferase
MPTESKVVLVEADDGHFAWMLEGESAGSRFGLTLPPGGVDSTSTLELLRKMTRKLLDEYGRGTWLVVEGTEVVGLCGFKQPPDEKGAVEIGYGIAASRRGMGLATLAVAELLELTTAEASIRVILAETSHANRSSQRVLEKAGFEPFETRIDKEDGEIVRWKRSLR